LLPGRELILGVFFVGSIGSAGLELVAAIGSLFLELLALLRSASFGLVLPAGFGEFLAEELLMLSLGRRSESHRGLLGRRLERLSLRGGLLIGEELVARTDQATLAKLRGLLRHGLLAILFLGRERRLFDLGLLSFRPACLLNPASVVLRLHRECCGRSLRLDRRRCLGWLACRCEPHGRLFKLRLLGARLHRSRPVTSAT
jgi:hypothetical protein